MFDRSALVKSNVNQSEQESNEKDLEVNAQSNDVNIDINPDNEGPTLRSVNCALRKLYDLLSSLDANNKELESNMHKLQTYHDTDNCNTVLKRQQELFSSSYRMCSEVTESFKDASLKVKEAEALVDAVEHQILQNRLQHTIKRFQILANALRKNDLKLNDLKRNEFKRKAKLLNMDVGEINSHDFDDGNVKNTFNLLLHQQIYNHKCQEMVEAVSIIDYKNTDLKKTEKNMQQLNQMYADLNTMLHLQQDLIDDIESSVLTAKEFSNNMEAEIIKTSKVLRKNRKKKYWIAMIILIILIVICIPIVFFSI